MHMLASKCNTLVADGNRLPIAVNKFKRPGVQEMLQLDTHCFGWLILRRCGFNLVSH